MRIAILGTGRVGTALGTGWTNVGHTVVYGSRRPSSATEDTHAGAAAGADVVVLAVPFDAAVETVAAAGNLAGKIVVDATNPVGKVRSGAELVAAAAPGARVVKAFNTMGFETMADPVIDGRPALGLVAGDDGEAKAAVLQLAADLGFEAVDAGGLDAARMLETLAELWIHLAFRAGLRGPNAVAGHGRDMAFALLRR